MKFRIAPYLAALSALALVVSGIWLLDRSEQERFQQKTRSEALKELSTVQAKLEGGLNSQLFLARGLIAQISVNPSITIAEFDRQVRIMFADQESLRNITVTKGTVIIYSYPPIVANKSTIGVDIWQNPQQRKSIEQAINTRKSVVLGPINLIQGGVGFVNRSPIFITPENAAAESGLFWGFINFVIEQDILFEKAGLYNSSEQLQYAMRGKNGLGSLGEVFFGDGSIFQKNPIIVQVKLPNGYWQLAAIPRGGWLSSSPNVIWIRIGGGLLAVLTGILVFKWTEEPVKLRKIVQEKTVALKKANEDLEIRVEERTADLTQALEKLQTEITEREEAEEELRQSEAREREKSQQLEKTLVQLRSTQAQLIQTEKMSSLGQLVAGIAHEINNPVNFIHGNINYVDDYVQNLLGILQLYQQEYPQPSGEIPDRIEEIELDFLIEDLAKILSSMKMGTERIRSIVLSLRNFSRLDESDMKPVDIHEGIESTLLILQNRFKCKNNFPDIQLVKQFGDLPLVECYAGQLNQVFVNVIANAIDAIEQRFQGRSVEEMQANPGRIIVRTKVSDRDTAIIEISDNGSGMPEAVKSQIFNPFFTTKEVGKGTGLGMSISYQIVVEQHKGKFDCISEIGQGTTFIIEIPIKN